jgi:hypothetical protein
MMARGNGNGLVHVDISGEATRTLLAPPNGVTVI